jgi:hypothetical protein
MTGKAHTPFEGVEPFGPEWEDLRQQNGSLRAIVAELLIKNQNLRWELLGQKWQYVQEPREFIASEETPLRRNSRIAGMP